MSNFDNIADGMMTAEQRAAIVATIAEKAAAVPVVMSERPAKALGLSGELVSDKPDDQCRAIIKLLREPDWHEQQRAAQMEALAKSYGYATFRDGMQAWFAKLGVKLAGVP